LLQNFGETKFKTIASISKKQHRFLIKPKNHPRTSRGKAGLLKDVLPGIVDVLVVLPRKGEGSSLLLLLCLLHTRQQAYMYKSKFLQHRM
jgi:hypothetical protein